MICNRCKKECNAEVFNGFKTCNDCRIKSRNYLRKWKTQEKNVPSDCKKCNRCLVVKHNDEFFLTHDKCKKCDDYCNSYYKANKSQEIKRALKSQLAKGRDVINAYKRDLAKRHPENILLQSARHRAKTLQLPFDLTKEDIQIPKICPVLGIELKQGDKNRFFNSPSLDRVIPELGYVKGNICVISWRANSIKGDATLDELKKVTSYVERFTNQI